MATVLDQREMDIALWEGTQTLGREGNRISNSSKTALEERLKIYAIQGHCKSNGKSQYIIFGLA